MDTILESTITGEAIDQKNSTQTTSKKRGKFIVLEGGEGAGKSSQSRKLKEFFESSGQQFIFSREPGGSPYAEEIRHVILKSEHAGQANAKSHFALFWAARADHLKNTILPAIEAGINVISDRFDSTTFAYQIRGQGASELENFFWKMRDFYLDGCEPDIYIYLDVTPEEGLRRKQGQIISEMNHFDERQLSFHQRTRDGFMEFFQKVPHKVIDAGKPFNEVYNELRTAIAEIL